MGLLTFLFRAARKSSVRKKWGTPRATTREKPVNQYHRKDPGSNFQTAEPNKGLQDAKVEKIIDGDTVIVSTSFRKFWIRLDSIDCPEDGQQWGDIAKFGLIKLIGGRKIRLEEHGLDRYERTLA
ncbi:MAG: thermonuclease family protein, partial [Candidatus Scalindua sp.]